MTLEPGTKLGRYEIRSKIGEGGMGDPRCFLATKPGTDVVLNTVFG